MIGRITGILVYNVPPRIMLEVNGIAYEIDCPMSTIYCLPPLNQSVALYTQLLIREDGHYLYGFIDQQQKQVFKELLRVSGIGARIALAILSGLEVADIVHAIENHQITLLSTIPGIGKKTAERLVLELSGRLQGISAAPKYNINFDKSTINTTKNIRYDAMNALLSLGYSDKEANNALKKIDNINDLDISQAIKQALNLLSKH